MFATAMVEILTIDEEGVADRFGSGRGNGGKSKPRPPANRKTGAQNLTTIDDTPTGVGFDFFHEVELKAQVKRQWTSEDTI